MVVIYHVGLVKGSLGAAGVTVFFALSGYLITQLLLEERDGSGRISLQAFYSRRLRRLLPALWVMVAVVTLIGLLTVHAHTLAEALFALTYLGNLPSVAGNVGQPLSHTWSLAIEEQFYLIWPLVMIVTRTRRRALVVATVGIFAVALHRLTAVAPNAELAFASDMQADALLIGAALALTCWRDRYGVMASIGIVAFLLLGVTDANLRIAPLVVGAATAVAIAGALESSIFARALAWRPLVVLGKRSYSLYLWHLPILFYSGTLGTPSIVLTPAALLVSLAFTEASYRWIETPLRRMARQGRVLTAATHSGIGQSADSAPVA
jgi:peptidoglycan/LPS O-acetylase OafA/YrhL